MELQTILFHPHKVVRVGLGGDTRTYLSHDDNAWTMYLQVCRIPWEHHRNTFQTSEEPSQQTRHTDIQGSTMEPYALMFNHFAQSVSLNNCIEQHKAVLTQAKAFELQITAFA